MGSCSCEDGEPLDILSQQIIRARKSHRCFECGREIHAGDQYEKIKGVDCDGHSTFKTCLFCARVRDDLVSMNYCVMYGGLWALTEEIERGDI